MELGGRGNGLVLVSRAGTACPFCDVTSGDSSSISAMTGLGDLLWPLMIVGLNDIRTQFWRLCPLRALGLPFNADGLPDARGEGSQRNGFPLLLRADDALSEVCESCRVRAT